MDLGEPFKREIRITPAEENSFVVHVCAEGRLDTGRVFGFTTIDDLLIWMARHAAKARPSVTQLKEGDVIGGETGGVHNPYKDALNGIRRTTAAKTLAEHVEELGRRPVSDSAPTPAA